MIGLKYLLFFLFSTMESFSIVFLGLILFRERVRSLHILKSISIGFILTCVSLLLISLDLKNVSPPIQMIIMFLLVYKMFNRRWLHSLLITLTPYFLFALIQAIFIYILHENNLVNMNELTPFTFKGYMIQFFSFLLVVITAAVIKRTNEGYSFVPEESMKEKVKYSNKILTLVLGISSVVICGLYYEYRASQIIYSFMVLSVGIVISTFILLYITLKRDKEESA